MATVTSPFGKRRDPLNPTSPGKKDHTGVDFATPIGAPMYATRPLIVDRNYYQMGSTHGYGYNVVARDPVTGQQYRFAHLDSKPNWKPGDTIKPGEVVGHTGNSGGSTGPHLHYEVINNGKPVDPALYKDSTPVTFEIDKDRSPIGTIWTTDPIEDTNYTGKKDGKKNNKTKKDANQDSTNKAPTSSNKTNDPIEDLVRRKEEADRRKEAARKESYGKERRNNEGRSGQQRPAKTTGSPFHRGHDGG